MLPQEKLTGAHRCALVLIIFFCSLLRIPTEEAQPGSLKILFSLTFTVQHAMVDSLLGNVGVVLRHGHDEGDDEQAADDERELPALLLRLLLGLEVGLTLVLLERRATRVRQPFDRRRQPPRRAEDRLVVLLVGREHCGKQINCKLGSEARRRSRVAWP